MENKFRVNRPREMNAKFAEAFNSGAVENLLALYEPDAILINQNGESLKGLSAIKDELQKLLSFGGEMISENQYAFQNGNIALLRAKFVLKAINERGKSFEVIGHTSEIVRQQPNGNWLYIVDHPFGANA